MIYNEDAYYTGYARNVRIFGGGSKGAYTALVFDTIAGLIRDKGIGEIANNTLLDMLGGSKPTLLAAIELVIKCGYLEKRCGDGRGNKSIYYITEKGKKNCPFMKEKGEKIFTKRVKKFNEKGKEIYPLNKELNKELKESGGDMRTSAQSPALSTTTTFLEDFEEFWNLSKWGSSGWDWRKQECAAAWREVSEELRKNLVNLARSGMKWRLRDNEDPFWYIKNYHGRNIMKEELPYIKQGTPECTKWLNDANRDHKKVIVIRYEAHVVYCYAKDWAKMEAAGAEFLNYYNF